MSKNKQYWIYGKHAVLAALQNKNRKVEHILATKQALMFLEDAGVNLDNLKINYLIEKIETIASRVGTSSSQGIAMLTKTLVQPDIKEYIKQNTLATRSIIVILDQVSDPQNIGSIIRSAAAFGANALVMPYDHSPGETAAMVKASAGAFERTPIISVTNIASTIKFLKNEGFWIIGMDHSARDDIHQTNLVFDKVALVLGSEESGIRPLTKNNCDLLLKIPIESNNMESLNVANAAAIALYSIAIAK